VVSMLGGGKQFFAFAFCFDNPPPHWDRPYLHKFFIFCFISKSINLINLLL
jgi:hypothetical protein